MRYTYVTPEFKLISEDNGDRKWLDGTFGPKDFGTKDVSVYVLRGFSACIDEFYNAMGKINNPNILNVFGLVEGKNGDWYLIVEKITSNLVDFLKSTHPERDADSIMIPGLENLSDFWKNGYLQPPIKEIMRSVLKGLQYLHENDIYLELRLEDVVILTDGVKIKAKLFLENILFSTEEKDMKNSSIRSLVPIFRHIISLDINNCKFDKDPLVLREPEAEYFLSELFMCKEEFSAEAFLNHPIFWDSHKCMWYICTVSNIIQLSPDFKRELNQQFEEFLVETFNEDNPGSIFSWAAYLGSFKFFLSSIPDHEKPNVNNCISLMRFIRNCNEHWNDRGGYLETAFGNQFQYFEEYVRRGIPNFIPIIYEYVRKTPLIRSAGILERQFY